MTKFIDLALLKTIDGLQIGALALATAFAMAARAIALADSKSAAEFVLKTCLPAMEDLDAPRLQFACQFNGPNQIPFDSRSLFVLTPSRGYPSRRP